MGQNNSRSRSNLSPPLRAIYIDPVSGEVVEYKPKLDSEGKTVPFNPDDHTSLKRPDKTEFSFCNNGPMGDMVCKGYDQNAAWEHYKKTGKQARPEDFMICPSATCSGGQCSCGDDCNPIYERSLWGESGVKSCCPKVYETPKGGIRSGMCVKPPPDVPVVTTHRPTTRPVTTQPVTTQPAQVSSSCTASDKTIRVTNPNTGEKFTFTLPGDTICSWTN